MFDPQFTQQNRNTCKKIQHMVDSGRLFYAAMLPDFGWPKQSVYHPFTHRFAKVSCCLWQQTMQVSMRYLVSLPVILGEGHMLYGRGASHLKIRIGRDWPWDRLLD
jgi:hypothetical protein